jgi:hypothetical protein
MGRLTICYAPQGVDTTITPSFHPGGPSGSRSSLTRQNLFEHRTSTVKEDDIFRMSFNGKRQTEGYDNGVTLYEGALTGIITDGISVAVPAV